MAQPNKPSTTYEAGIYPIRTVATMTGVKPVTLRAWERRYGLLRPRRTPKGHRMYSRGDVERIRAILDLLEEGIPIGRIRNILDLSTMHSPESPQILESGGWLGFRNRMLEAIAGYEEGALESAHNEALALYPTDVTNRHLIRPVLNDLRKRAWNDPHREGELLFFRTYLRSKLGERYLHQRRESAGPRLMLAGLPESDTDLDMLTFALAAQDHAYRPVPLGSDTPPATLLDAVEHAHARGLVVFIGPTPLPEPTEEELYWLVDRLRIPLYLSGRTNQRRIRALAPARPIPSEPGDALSIIDADLKHTT